MHHLVNVLVICSKSHVVGHFTFRFESAGRHNSTDAELFSLNLNFGDVLDRVLKFLLGRMENRRLYDHCRIVSRGECICGNRHYKIQRANARLYVLPLAVGFRA